MNKFKLFTENFLVYGLGGVIAKIIPFIMTPIVVRIMPSSDYFGISDLYGTVVSFSSSFAIMGMYDAMFRLFFDREDLNYKRTVCSTSLIFVIITSVLICLIMLIFREHIARIFISNKKYSYLIYLAAIATLVNATNAIISAPTRMQNKRRVFLVTNTVSPIISYSISILLLLKGLYVIALPLASLGSCITIAIAFGIMNREWFDLKMYDGGLLKELLMLAIPIFPNFIIYWLFNSCDKLMITNMIGIDAAGVYSVGSKLGHASQLIYAAFAGGWQYFAFATMNDEKQVESNSKVFEYLGVLSFIATTFICAWCYSIYKILFPKQYLDGFIIVPYLFLSPLLLMLFQVIANQFLVIKKSWPGMLILSVGAIINILTNYILIGVMGIEGAALATLLGYMITVTICAVVLIKMNLFVISQRFVIVTIFIIVFLCIWRIFFSFTFIISTMFAIMYTCIIIFMYRKEIESIINR